MNHLFLELEDLFYIILSQIIDFLEQNTVLHAENGNGEKKKHKPYKKGKKEEKKTKEKKRKRKKQHRKEKIR